VRWASGEAKDAGSANGLGRAQIRLSEQDGRLTFEVDDDGSGFDPAATAYGTGLQGI